MIELISITLLVACAAAFLLLLGYKWGQVEILQTHGNEWLSKMAHCDFCMSWWLCVIISALIWAVTGDNSLFFVPFLATPITRRLI